MICCNNLNNSILICFEPNQLPSRAPCRAWAARARRSRRDRKSPPKPNRMFRKRQCPSRAKTQWKIWGKLLQEFSEICSKWRGEWDAFYKPQMVKLMGAMFKENVFLSHSFLFRGENKFSFTLVLCIVLISLQLQIKSTWSSSTRKKVKKHLFTI